IQVANPAARCRGVGPATRTAPAIPPSRPMVCRASFNIVPPERDRHVIAFHFVDRQVFGPVHIAPEHYAVSYCHTEFCAPDVVNLLHGIIDLLECPVAVPVAGVARVDVCDGSPGSLPILDIITLLDGAEPVLGAFAFEDVAEPVPEFFKFVPGHGAIRCRLLAGRLLRGLLGCTLAEMIVHHIVGRSWIQWGSAGGILSRASARL